MKYCNDCKMITAYFMGDICIYCRQKKVGTLKDFHVK